MKFRAWWIPQIPMEPFLVPVKSLAEGRRLLIVLANYDKFQFEHRIKPDYSSAGGIEQWTGADWEEIDEDE